MSYRESDVIVKNEKNLKAYLRLCEEGKNRKEISEIMGVTLRSVTNYQKTTGVKPVYNPRLPNLNEDYFSAIDTEEKAYILGFIYADGYFESHERALTFNISRKDIDILLKIKKALDCGNEIKESTTKNCVRLYLSSTKLVADLKKLGLSSRKSLVVRFPKLEENLYRHFIRGFFDGDGHIGKRQCALVIGSDSFYKGFSEYIKRTFGKELYKNDMGNYYRVQFNRGDHEIINWMYKDSNIYLDRKHKAYLDYWHDYTERIRSRG